MKAQNELVGRVVGKDNLVFSRICPGYANECTTALVKQTEVDEPEAVGAHWSGQPGKDLFFNSWKLLF